MHPFFSIREKLPAIQFDPAADRDVSQFPALQDYLGFYQLTPDRAICRQHVMGRFDAGGYQLAAHYWMPASQEIRGTVFFLHGYYDHTGLFRHLFEFLLQERFAVLAYDLPGHGLSSGEPASIGDFTEYATVLQHCLSLSSRMPRPWIGMGQSTGCAVILHALMQERLANPFARTILLAPLIRPAHWERGIWLYRLLAPFRTRLTRHVTKNSHDEAFLHFIHHEDPLQSKYLKTAWARAMKRWLDSFESLDPLQLPALVVQGEADETVDWRYNLAQLQNKLRGACFFRLPGAAHHLANERDDLREQVFGEIRRYLASPLGENRQSHA